MISIIIPLYNKEQSIEKTISSVLFQTFGQFELIIVDDGSTDQSVTVVKKIDDKRIRLVEKANGGVSSARNRGVLESSYEWIAFLDADDLWHKDFLRNIVNVINSVKNVYVITTNFSNVTRDGSILSKFETSNEGFYDFFDITNKQGWHITNMSTLCVSKGELLKTGLFSLNKTHGEDIEVVEKLARMHKFWVIDKVLSYYVQDAENRAMLKSPNIYKTRVYNIESHLIESVEEETYFKKAILLSIYNYTFNLNFKSFYILLKKHLGFVTLSEIFNFFITKLFKKIRG